MATGIGALATRSCELRQARKGATVAVASGAEVMLVWVATFPVARMQCGVGCCLLWVINVSRHLVRFSYIIPFIYRNRNSSLNELSGSRKKMATTEFF